MYYNTYNSLLFVDIGKTFKIITQIKLHKSEIKVVLSPPPNIYVQINIKVQNDPCLKDCLA